MKEVVVVDAVRTPMGRSKGGIFRNVRADTLSAEVITALLRRNPEVSPAEIDDIVWGCAQQTLEQAFNVARFAQLLTDIPKEVSAQTINRLCGSSMTALHHAAMAIMALTIPRNSLRRPMQSLKPTGLPSESSRNRTMKSIISRGVE